MSKLTKLICTAIALGASGLAVAQMPSPEEIMKENDKNKDGVITKAEAEAGGTPLAQFFDQLDADKDGKITMAELKAFGGP